MRVGLFSDVHGNAVALDAMLADAPDQRLDQLVCLGDHVQGGVQPAECLDRLRSLECRVVLGNADHEVLEPARDIEEWSAAQLTREQLDFVRTFEAVVDVELADGARLLCFHGSPRSFDDVVLPETPTREIEPLVAGHDATVYAGGHVHLQWLRRLGAAVWLCDGSVGFAYDRDRPDGDFALDPWAEYVIVTAVDGRIGVEFRRVPFDAGAYADAVAASGRPGADDLERSWRRR